MVEPESFFLNRAPRERFSSNNPQPKFKFNLDNKNRAKKKKQVGICITCLSALALLGSSEHLNCALSLWGYSLGFDLAFGALALMLWGALSAAEVRN